MAVLSNIAAFRLLLMLSTALLMTACEAAQLSQDRPDIEFNCHVDQALLVEARVILQCSVTSTLANPITILPWNTPLESRLLGAYFTVYTDKGDSLPYQGLMVKRAAPEESDYLVISPNEPLNNQIELTQAYRFCAATQYTIEYHAQQTTPSGHVLKLMMNPLQFIATPNFAICAE